MKHDAEMKALGEVFNAIKELDDNGKRWVLDSLYMKFFPSETGRQSTAAAGATKRGGLSLTSFESVAEVFAKASPSKDPDKALVVAAYLQEKEERPELTSRDINGQLKHLGHGINNITAAINSLKGRKPKLMVQTRKEGTSQQAPKKYKVTIEGLNRVREMLGSVQ